MSCCKKKDYKLPLIQIGCFPDHSPLSWQVLCSFPLRTQELLQKKAMTVPIFAQRPFKSPVSSTTLLQPLSGPPGSEQLFSSRTNSRGKNSNHFMKLTALFSPIRSLDVSFRCCSTTHASLKTPLYDPSVPYDPSVFEENQTLKKQ